MKKIALLLALLALAGAAFGQTGVKYFVAHQGGYIGEATVTVDARGNVVAASLAEWQGPGGWVEEKIVDGKEVIAEGAAVRVPDPLANATNTDPEIKGYMFYTYSGGLWLQLNVGKDAAGNPAFVKSTNLTRDFEGLMSNPIRARAYVEAAKADKLVNVTTEGLKVIIGRKASESVHYGHMDKANPAATYMPIAAASIGYRYNTKALLDFFKANPAANYFSYTTKKVPMKIVADKKVDAADAAAYTATEDTVFAVADVVTGATYSDFPHYALELQAAYKAALAEQKVAFKK